MISVRNMFIEFGIIIACFIITLFFPPLIIGTTPLLLLVSWYFTGFSLMDYNTERYRYNVKDSVRYIRDNKGLVIGVGCVYWLFMSIPTFAGDILGLMFGPALASLGATLSFLEIRKKMA
jgi:CysZ protein